MSCRHNGDLLKRLYRWLTSPKLAIALILGITAYAVVGTVVPQPALGPEEADRWAAAHPLASSVARPLGLFEAFSSPLFIAVVLLLGASTIACAVSRTKAARSMTRTGAATEAIEVRIQRHPTAAVGDLTQSEADLALARLRTTLESEGFSVRGGPRVTEATKSMWGAYGSPVFHWALAALIPVFIISAAFRAEGVLSIPVGGSVTDDAAAYGKKVSRGPLHPGHSGLEFRARDFKLATMVDGLDRGHSAVVGVYRNGAMIAERRVYPNSPLRVGRLLIHRTSDWGYAPLMELRAPDAKMVATMHAYIPASSVSSDGAGPGVLSVSDARGPAYELDISIPASGTDSLGMPRLQRAVSVVVRPTGGATLAPVRISEGASVQLPDGGSLRFAKRGYFMDISVADDAAVPAIYALFVLAAIGLVVAVLFPPKRVWILVSEDEGVYRIQALSRHLRGDPNFPAHVGRIVESSVRPSGSEQT